MSFLYPLPIAKPWRHTYLALRGLLYLLIAMVTIYMALRALFPVITQQFDFRSPGSSKNTILHPRAPDATPRENGKIEAGSRMIADTTVVGDFSLLSVRANLEKKSAFPETLDFSVRRSYQSFLYPTGAPVTDFPTETAYRLDDTYYALRDGVLHPFVSQAAYLSHLPEGRAVPADQSLLSLYPISEQWLGFRVGSLLGNATGVFIVVSETEVRPVGSAEIFLALGYRFEDVVSVSEEELGVYERGRIILLGAAHPDGTILRDIDNDTYFIIEEGTKRPLPASPYRDFLLTHTTYPILVSTTASETTLSCTLTPNVWGTALLCELPITLPTLYGNDFELSIGSGTAIDMNSLTASFETAQNRENMLTLLSQIKQRLLARFGGA